MRKLRCALSAVLLSAAISITNSAMADPLPKEGMFNNVFTGFGTWKGTAVGKGRFVTAWDENGLSVGTGLTDHMTWHCFGLQDVVNGVGQGHGFCLGTDPDGDQIVNDITSEKHAWDAKSYEGSGTITTGTGKYDGITGSFTYTFRGSEFRAASDGTYFEYSSLKGSYKLP